MVKIDTLFLTKMAKIPYPLAPHIPISPHPPPPPPSGPWTLQWMASASKCTLTHSWNTAVNLNLSFKMVTNKCVHVRETGCFNTKLFQYRSFRYELKQGNCTKILITSSKVWNWTRKFFWVNILYCLSQVRETIHTWKELTCIKTTLYRNYP